MATQAFNALTGVSVGSNANLVIDADSNAYFANVSANFANLTGNVSANNFIGNGANINGNITANFYLGDGGYLSNIGAALTVSQYTTGSISNSIGNVSNLLFDTTTGFNVTSLGANTALISLGSSFKTWQVAGQTSLVAVGEDTVEFVDGNNIVITTNAAARPQQIEFSLSENVSITGNLVVGNANLGNAATANFFVGDGGLLTNVSIAGGTTILNGNSNVKVLANGNVTTSISGNSNVVVVTGTGMNVAGTLNTTGNANVGNLTIGTGAAGSINGANVVSANYFIGNGALLTGLSFNSNTIYNGNSNVAVSLNSNVSISVAGTPNVLVVSNVGVNINGNLTVDGNLTYVNVDNLYVTDPIIELGGGPNDAPLTGNDGKDRGTLLHYYTTAPVDAFMGWDNSNSEFIFGSNVTNTSDVITVSKYGNIRANFYIGDGSKLSNITGANVTGTVPYANVANSVAVANVSGIGNIATLNLDGSSSNVLYGNGVFAPGASTSSISNGSSNVNIDTVDGNVTTSVGGTANVFVVSTTSANLLGDLNVSGNAIFGNTTGQVSINGDETNGAIEIGQQERITAGTPYLDFHSSVDNLDYDVRLMTSGGGVSPGLGNLDIYAGNLIVNTGIIYGNGSGLSNIAGANVTGSIANANYATFAGTAYSVDGANVSGTVANANYAAIAGTAYSVDGANVSGEVANANYATFAGTAYSVDGANVSGTVANANNANYLSGITANGLFNNMGQNFATYNNFDSPDNYGFQYIAGNANGPANVGGTEYYTVASGLGNEYAYSSFAQQMAFPRLAGGGTPYLTVRQKEGGTWGAWTTINAGIADVAYSVDGANVSGQVSNANYAIYANTSDTANSVAVANVVGIGNIATINLDGNSNTVLYGNGVFAPATGGNSNGSAIINGNSNVVVLADSNVVTSVSGNSNVVVVTGTGINVAGTLNASGDSYLGNLSISTGVGGSISGANVVSANYFIGNGALLTGISSAPFTIFNGTSNVYVNLNGNVTTSVNGNANVFVVSGNSASLTGNLYLPNTPTGIVSGTLGQTWTANFDGAGSFVTAPSGITSGSWTIEFWVNPSTVSGNHTMVSSSGGGYPYGFHFWIQNGLLMLDDSVTGQPTFSSIAADTWTHFALVRDSVTGITTVYKDGVVVQDTYTGLGTPGTGFIIGIQTSVNWYFAGAMSNFRVVDGIKVYTAAFTLPTLLLEATQTANTNGNPSAAITGTETVLLTFENSTFVDNSSFNYTITPIGTMTTVNQSVPFAGSLQGTLLFNGSQWEISPALTVNGTITAPTVVGTYFIGDGSNISNIAGANIIGEVSNANYASFSNIANVAYSVDLANVVGIGNIASINIDGSSSNVLYGNGVFAPGGGGGGNGTAIVNGTSNVIVELDGNVSTSVAGNANVFVVTGTGANLNGDLTVVSNVTAANFNGSGAGTPTVTSATNLDLSAPVSVRVVGGGTLRLPNLTDADIANLIGANGDIIYNTTVNTVQAYENGAWANINSGGGGNGTAIVNGNSSVIVSANGNVSTSVAGNANIFVVTDTGANVNGNLTVTNISNLGNVGNVKITGGANGQILQTDGTGNLNWYNKPSGGTGFIYVYTRTSGAVEVQLVNSVLNIVGRSGNIPVPIS